MPSARTDRKYASSMRPMAIIIRRSSPLPGYKPSATVFHFLPIRITGIIIRNRIKSKRALRGGRAPAGGRTRRNRGGRRHESGERDGERTQRGGTKKPGRRRGRPGGGCPISPRRGCNRSRSRSRSRNPRRNRRLPHPWRRGAPRRWRRARPSCPRRRGGIPPCRR